MAKLPLSIAIGPYDRVRPIMDGAVRIDGVDPVFLSLDPEEIFFRAFKNEEFDVCELSLSSFSVRQSKGDNPYVGVPVFPSRFFRHTAIYIRKDCGIEKPEDLKGRRVGLPEYQLTACVWARIILDAYGVKPHDVTWVRGGLETPGREEKIKLDLPDGVVFEEGPEGKTLSEMLEDGDIDALVSPRAPHCFNTNPNIGWLFPDPMEAGKEYYRETGIFPIMHILGVRKTLVEQHPWLPVALLKAFTEAKELALKDFYATAAQRISLPFMEETATALTKLMGPDLWPYGLEENRNVLETFLSHHHAQGLSKRKLAPEDLFARSTHELVKI